MKRTYYVRVTGERGCAVIVSDEPWQGDLSVTDESAITAERIQSAARRKTGLPLFIGETERLWVREFCEEDFPALCELLSEEEDFKNAGMQAAFLRDEAYFKAYIRNQYPFFGYGMWGIFLKESGAFAGISGFYSTEVPAFGYYIRQKFRRRGYAFEACRAVFRYVKRELFPERIAVHVKADNKESRALAEKLQREWEGEDGRSQSCVFELKIDEKK